MDRHWGWPRVAAVAILSCFPYEGFGWIWWKWLGSGFGGGKQKPYQKSHGVGWCGSSHPGAVDVTGAPLASIEDPDMELLVQ